MLAWKKIFSLFQTHGDFVLLAISIENRGLAILTTHVKSSACVENKFILVSNPLNRLLKADPLRIVTTLDLDMQ